MERVLLKLCEAGLVRGPLRPLFANRAWRVQAGEAAGIKMIFPQNLEFLRGSTERPMQRCVADHLEPGDVFYDIGANVGFFSLLAARRVGPSGSVYAFEPVAENVSAIQRNFELNQIRTGEVFSVALGEKSGAGDLLVTKWDGGSTLSSAAVPPGEGVERRRVPVASLDDLIRSAKLRPPTFIKIDVEGAELEVLHGMMSTLAEHRPTLVYEVDDGDQARLSDRWADLDRLVGSLGYTVTHLEDSYSNVHWYVGHSLATPRVKPPAASSVR